MKGKQPAPPNKSQFSTLGAQQKFARAAKNLITDIKGKIARNNRILEELEKQITEAKSNLSQCPCEEAEKISSLNPNKKS